MGPSGIRPDLSKLTAIVDWKTLTDLQNLGAFTRVGCSSGEREGSIQGCDEGSLPREVVDERTRARVPRLKTARTSEPIFKSPKFDRTLFVITTVQIRVNWDVDTATT